LKTNRIGPYRSCCSRDAAAVVTSAVTLRHNQIAGGNCQQGIFQQRSHLKFPSLSG
jgi:hypothetical protein